LASQVAKLLLTGKRVVVVNAERALFSGNRQMVIGQWRERLRIASVVQPKHGPFHPRAPDRLLRRIVRGMLPRRKPRGVAALRHLRVYVGVPTAYIEAPRLPLRDAGARKPRPFYVSVAEVAREIGWGRV
jgi:large subunit ribosomal protein L13